MSPDSSKCSVYSLTLKPPHYACCLLLTSTVEGQYFGVPEMEKRLEENRRKDRRRCHWPQAFHCNSPAPHHHKHQWKGHSEQQRS